MSNQTTIADDCLIHISITPAADMEKLQSELKKLEIRQNTWQKEFNPEKRFIMYIQTEKSTFWRIYFLQH